MVQESYTKDDLDTIFAKGKVISGKPKSDWREDACGNTIARSEYGNEKSPYGWEVDHIYPNGGNGMSNLRPLKISENRSKGDKTPGEHGC